MTTLGKGGEQFFQRALLEEKVGNRHKARREAGIEDDFNTELYEALCLTTGNTLGMGQKVETITGVYHCRGLEDPEFRLCSPC